MYGFFIFENLNFIFLIFFKNIKYDFYLYFIIYEFIEFYRVGILLKIVLFIFFVY